MLCTRETEHMYYFSVFRVVLVCCVQEKLNMSCTKTIPSLNHGYSGIKIIKNVSSYISHKFLAYRNYIFCPYLFWITLYTRRRLYQLLILFDYRRTFVNSQYAHTNLFFTKRSINFDLKILNIQTQINNLGLRISQYLEILTVNKY